MSKAYVSWDITEDDLYDDEGDVVGIEEYVLIEKVWVPTSERGQGKGRQLIVEALAEIEIAHPGMTIKIAALPFDGGMEMAELVEWYETFGFDVTDTSGHAVIMSK